MSWLHRQIYNTCHCLYTLSVHVCDFFQKKKKKKSSFPWKFFWAMTLPIQHREPRGANFQNGGRGDGVKAEEFAEWDHTGRRFVPRGGWAAGELEMKEEFRTWCQRSLCRSHCNWTTCWGFQSHCPLLTHTHTRLKINVVRSFSIISLCIVRLSKRS